MRSLNKFALLALAATFAACSSSSDSATPISLEPKAEPVTVLAIADLADCRRPSEEIAQALRETEGTIIMAGDLAIPDGSAEAFTECFNPLYQTEVDRILAVPGNNEYRVNDAAAPFFANLGDSAGNPGEGWLSTQLGDWHIIGLNSQCENVAGGCDEDSPQYKWLEQELNSNPSECRLAFWHEPRFTSSKNYSGFPRLDPMYRLLYEAGTDVLVTGNSHIYERFEPLNPEGEVDPESGIANFTIGLGGDTFTEAADTPLEGSAVLQTKVRGFVEFTLREGRYDWAFRKVGTGDLSDSGSKGC